MSIPDVERLRSIKTFPSLVKYLRDELDWPIESEDFDELTFDYEPEELGLDTKTAVNVKEIKQLRPLVANQPWGIFFINFEPKRLPIVVLRRILRALVLKKRQSASKPQQATWNLHDLLFISSYGETDHRDITFAHFAEEDGTGDLPTLRVLGWDDEDTVLHLADADQKLREKLHWPEDPKSLEDWRSQWSSAFTLRPREVIGTSKALAERLAELATSIRKRANRVLSIESETGPLRKLMAAFREALIHDLKEDDFADTYAQTITYGLLTARVSRPAGLVAENVRDMVPITNPFLRDMLSAFLTVGGRKGKIDFDELGINDVVQALRDADMEAVLRDFGDKSPQEDPVIYFYELFLKEYDPVKRIKRGVFFTPRPVVSFIVRSVDEMLRKEFGLEDGLADTTTWGEMAKRHACRGAADAGGTKAAASLPHSMKIPEGVKPDEPFVRILDPACGTGTFLVEVIDVIYRTMGVKWRKERHMELELPKLWNDYVAGHLLPRLYGFELMMAPYAIAHMKIGLKLHETGYDFRSHERARIYLTNSLEEPKDFADRFEFDAPALAHEAHAVNAVKRHGRFTIVVGNPPYANSTTENPWILGLLEDYRRGLHEQKSDIGREEWKFVRYATYQVGVSGAGIMGFVVNNSFLDGPTLRLMRKQLLETHSRGYFVNLHGDTNKREVAPDGSVDVNVFDIKQGVCVALLVKTRSADNALRSGRTQSADLWGERDGKYGVLARASVDGLATHKLQPKEPFFLLVTTGGTNEEEYLRWPSLKDLAKHVCGIETKRDHFAIDFDLTTLKKRVREFIESDISNGQAKARFDLRDNEWDVHDARKALRKDPSWQDAFIPCIYRPFDERFIIYNDTILARSRGPLMASMARPNMGLVVPRQTKEDFGALAINCVCTHKIVTVYDRSFLFPLYEYADVRNLVSTTNPLGRYSNLNPQLMGQVCKEMGRSDSPDAVAPEDAFHYIYGIFYSPGYRTRYESALRIDFPRIPFPSDYNTFHEIGALGADLIALHLLGDAYPSASWNGSKPKGKSPLQNLITKFAGKGDAEVAKGYPKFVASSSEAALECGSEATALDSSGEATAHGMATEARGEPKAATPLAHSKAGAGAPALQGAAAHRDTRRGRVYISPSRYFEGVPEDVWNFHIGGYQVCEKWLKDRRGRTLSDEDILHYQRVVVALNETIRIMGEIDQVIEAHGGWPGAFQVQADEAEV
jgi:hypothetical protein